MPLTDEQKTFFRSDFGDFWPFLAETDFPRDELLLEMEQQFRDLGVYSVGPWFGRLLNILVRFGRVNRVLELGTATGYSAVWMARGLSADGKLVSIERDEDLAAVASENLHHAGLSAFVDVTVGEAESILPSLQTPFDMIFVDCAHMAALDSVKETLKPGGLFVCDNVGFSNKDTFNSRLTSCEYLETLYLHCYLKGRIPENQAFSISIRPS